MYKMCGDVKTQMISYLARYRPWDLAILCYQNTYSQYRDTPAYKNEYLEMSNIPKKSSKSK